MRVEPKQRKQPGLGPGRKMTKVLDLIKEDLKSNLPMESVVTLIAEWFSLGEVIKLQELSALISVKLSDWQDKDTLDEIRDQVWNDLTEEWAVRMYEEGEPSLIKCVTKAAQSRTSTK